MSESLGDPGIGIPTSSLPDPPKTANPALADLSPRDKPWDKHRFNADRVEAHYRGSEFDAYAQRVHFCSELLQFGLTQDWDEDAMKLRLRSARFCRVRHCPVCQWRRSLMWKAKAYKVLPKIVQAYPTHRWVFLTLTIKNVPITELRDNLVAETVKLLATIRFMRITKRFSLKSPVVLDDARSAKILKQDRR